MQYRRFIFTSRLEEMSCWSQRESGHQVRKHSWRLAGRGVDTRTNYH